ncbi:hypothetical protein DPMN_134063 [Dreissena polymorpha]|uniref:EGF-like domain-containing protein n=1 Tax=Dreissena polymorpha TaxID=45954 RepID=A0A9D4FWR0_DREPO|nr:hypothetical protein DPMN_134063 [Dreissena polymorpha]
MGNYTCVCDEGWYTTDNGLNCATDIDECLKEPCLNNGTCKNTIGSFHCACTQNWTGSTCEIDLLTSFGPFSGG